MTYMKPKWHPLAGIMLAISFPALVVIVLMCACQTSAPGPLKPIDPAVYPSITNAVATAAHTAGQALPSPAGAGVELAGGIVIAALALWQMLTHRKVTILLNGQDQTKKETKP